MIVVSNATPLIYLGKLGQWLIEIIKSRPELWISDSLCDQALTQARQMAK